MTIHKRSTVESFEMLLERTTGSGDDWAVGYQGEAYVATVDTTGFYSYGWNLNGIVEDYLVTVAEDGFPNCALQGLFLLENTVLTVLNFIVDSLNLNKNYLAIKKKLKFKFGTLTLSIQKPQKIKIYCIN